MKMDEEEKIVPLLPDLNVTIITVCLKRFYVRPEYVGARFEFLSKSNCPDVGSELWLYIPLKGGMKKGNSGREVFKSFEVSLSELSDDEIMFDPLSHNLTPFLPMSILFMRSLLLGRNQLIPLHILG